MTLSDLEQLPMLRRLTPEPPAPRPVESVFCCDLLSLAMSRARAGCAWVTVMANLNTVAVATLPDAACLVFAEGIPPPEGCVAKAAEEGIAVYTSPLPVYETARAIDGGRL